MSYFAPYSYSPRNGIQHQESNQTSKKPESEIQPNPAKSPVVGRIIDASTATHRQEDVPVKKERRNRPGQRFGAKKKSWVWSWFAQDSNNPNMAACDFCGKIIVRLASDKGSPKKLSEHLKTHKLSKETINYSRQVPVDGNGITYTTSGDPVEYSQEYAQESPSAPSITTQPVQTHQMPSHQHYAPQIMPVSGIRSPPPSEKRFNFNNRFVSADFDNSPYSPMKFHRHLMKFLTENKLPINVIKSHSFQQLIYDLRSDSVADLMELTGLYSSLLEVSRYENVGSAEENQAVNALTSVVESKIQ